MLDDEIDIKIKEDYDKFIKKYESKYKQNNKGNPEFISEQKE